MSPWLIEFETPHHADAGRRVQAPRTRGGGTGGRSGRADARTVPCGNDVPGDVAKIKEAEIDEIRLSDSAHAAQHWAC